MTADFLRALLDLCFPPRCLACDGLAWDEPPAPLAGLCRPCARALPGQQTRCPACGRRAGPFQPGPGCPSCAGPQAERDALSWSGSPAALRRRALGQVVPAWPYGGVARDLVLALKFRGRPAAARVLAAPLVEALRQARIPGDLVVPVPLSRRRRRRRGYDQAALIAQHVARDLGLDLCARALRRTRHTPAQSGRSRATRSGGLGGAFRARPRLVRGRCVLLVDDVLTSGATARACARALRRAGALAVTAAVVCRA